jgi:putative nucleotidyltransferase with HDIG domain
MREFLRRVWQTWTLGGDAAASERARARLVAYPWPAFVLTALARLREDGGRAYLVGGTVRDVLLGRETDSSVDVATSVVPEKVMQRFERVVPTGLAHGTVTILDGLRPIECTTFRREDRYSDARRPDRVAFTADALEDLDRRDLTVNALAFDPSSGELLDPHGGARDLERRVLRAVGDPLDRFREDALRPLRVARLSATLELEPDDALERALARLPDPETGYRASGVALERVQGELVQMMTAREPSRGFRRLVPTGLLALWLPELDRCRGVPQNRYHEYDVFEHSLHTCDAAPRTKPVVRWAALLHDIGKPDTREDRAGEGTFYNHQFVGAELADRLLERLRFPTAFREAVVHLVREHMFDYRPTWGDAAVRRWLAHVGTDHLADLFDLRIADRLGNGRKRGFPPYLEELHARIDRLLRESRALHVRDLAVDGTDVMRELDIGPGPGVKDALEALLEEVLDHPDRNRREVLLARLAERRGERPSGSESRSESP